MRNWIAFRSLVRAGWRCIDDMGFIHAAFIHATIVLAVVVGGAFNADVRADEDAARRPNILVITVDDMSCDSVGAFGCALPDTTPHIDRLASQGLRFQHAHVQVGNCMPSRNVMFSGRFPHNNRVEGFYQIRDPDYPVLADLMADNDYFTGIRGKVTHSTPYHPYRWSADLDNIANGKADGNGKAHPKNIDSYYESTRRGIEESRSVKQPFCLIINVSDPHKPFYGTGKRNEIADDPNRPSRVFTAAEVPVPKFLPDHPDVRKELAQYYSSVRRADDCVGMILKALDESGQADNTMVMFLSDHGMPLPFAKTALYHHSTHTPWIARWPNAVKPGTIDDQHMISAVDLLPTLLDIAGIGHPAGLDGLSFLPLLRGTPQVGRDRIVKEYNENSGGNRHPMRSVQTRQFGYLFNPWSDGERVFKTATTGTASYRVMKQLATTDATVAQRLDLFDHRVVEEFYDYEHDPDALHNLIDDPAYRVQIDALRSMLGSHLERTGDPILNAFRHRDDPAELDKYVSQVEAESADRRKAGRKRPARQGKPGQPKARKDLIRIETPAVFHRGRSEDVVVAYTIPDDLGEQRIHVTIKTAESGHRIERKIFSVKGSGSQSVFFNIPHDAETSVPVVIAAFVGEEFPMNLQHVVTRPVSVQPLEVNVSPFKMDSLDGWTTQDGNPVEHGWSVEDGEIHLHRSDKRAGAIVTRDQFSDFRLAFEWKIAAGGNSGLKYRVRDYGKRLLGCEYQIYDDPQADQKPISPRKRTAALYDVFEPVAADDSAVTPRTAGEYNTSVIEVNGNSIRHWLNDVLVVSATVGDEEWNQRVSESKFSDELDFGANWTGRLMLTDHGSDVWYRNFQFEQLNVTERDTP